MPAAHCGRPCQRASCENTARNTQNTGLKTWKTDVFQANDATFLPIYVYNEQLYWLAGINLWYYCIMVCKMQMHRRLWPSRTALQEWLQSPSTLCTCNVEVYVCRARCWLTLLIEANALTTTPDHQPAVQPADIPLPQPATHDLHYTAHNEQTTTIAHPTAGQRLSWPL